MLCYEYFTIFFKMIDKLRVSQTKVEFVPNRSSLQKKKKMKTVLHVEMKGYWALTRS